jgi:hypothetical protein
MQGGTPDAISYRSGSSACGTSAVRSLPGEPLSYSEGLMKHLGILSFLADRSEHSLRFSYQKYKVFLTAVKMLDEKWKAGELPYTRRPLNEHIIEMMQSKTYWYDYIRKYFGKVGDYPEMVAWLENDGDVPSDLEVWGVEKERYSFGDLDLYLKSGGVGLVSRSDDKRENGKGQKTMSGGEKSGGNKKKGKGKEKEVKKSVK